MIILEEKLSARLTIRAKKVTRGFCANSVNLTFSRVLMVAVRCVGLNPSKPL